MHGPGPKCDTEIDVPCAGTPFESVVLGRSLFFLMAVQQWLAGFIRHAWAPALPLINMAEEHATAVLTTVPVEYINNVEKNTRQLRGTTL